MGEASRRKAEIEALKSRNGLWLESLSSTERVIAAAAQKAYDSVVVSLGMTEGCYHLAFFLYEHLRRHHGIKLAIVIGWVNDSQWGGATSHAWLEYEKKKIDISLHRTSHPQAQPAGDLIILDHIVSKGVVSYQYWTVLPEGAQRELERMAQDSPELAVLIQHKAEEHRRMKEFARRSNGAEEYLRQAPPEGSYTALERRM